MTISGAAALITMTPVPVRVGGILSVANVIDVTRGDHRLLGAQYETDACFGPAVWAGTSFCVTAPALCGLDNEALELALADIENPKTFDGESTLIEGTPFVATAGVECDLLRAEDGLTKAEARFDYGESAMVDGAMLTTLAALDTVIDAGPMPVNTAIGVAEEWIASRYGGTPTIVAPTAVLSDAIGTTVERDPLAGRLVTFMGTPVAAATRATGVDNSGPLYVTGRITLIRGPKVSYTAGPQQLSDEVCLPARALVERIYVPLIECVVGGITAVESAPLTAP